MRARLPSLLSAILFTGTAGAAAPQPHPLARSEVLDAAKAHGRALTTVMASPVVMVTRAVVAPDGSVHYVCEQMPNPHPVSIPLARQAPEPQQ